MKALLTIVAAGTEAGTARPGTERDARESARNGEPAESTAHAERRPGKGQVTILTPENAEHARPRDGTRMIGVNPRSPAPPIRADSADHCRNKDPR
ncbi:hypothetical protein [Actinoplanes palleronii]|uniref:Secreted protein n=1 Tax=Actinoplanes palleronii TaxID=113570 RepID=A0ABQ4B4K8_9ACTN|nr:hypothetical protein [Actinoplanes palleronii]GIE65597.1 hypothetical protein Apa02nite_017050 [Actinoplanes palleronii]